MAPADEYPEDPDAEKRTAHAARLEEERRRDRDRAAHRTPKGLSVPLDTLDHGGVARHPNPHPEAREYPEGCGWRSFWRFWGYLFWLPIVVALFVPLALLMTIPYTYFKSCRPWRRYPSGTKMEWNVRDKRGEDPTKYTSHRETKREEYNPFAKHPIRSWMAFWGEGAERNATSTRRKWRMFFTRRTWEVYQVSRELYRMISRQGLQITGIICGYVIILLQVEMMVNDYLSENLQKAWENPDTYKQDNALCPYITGTAIPFWADVSETRVWYGFYHVHICLLCVCLILDELFNVRMGIFAPQWSRMGNGYTIMFLACATMSTSANWGLRRYFRSRYLVVVSVLLTGIYNVARGWLAENELMTEKDVARTYRNRRYALRPWSEYEWFKTRDMPPFRRRSMEYAKEVERVKQAKKDGRYAVITLKKPNYWTERAQMHLGDRSIQLEAIAKNEWQFGEDERAAQIRYPKSWEQTQVEKGGVKRKFWLGNPTNLPLDMRHDKDWQAKARRGSEWKHGATFYGTHYWNPWKQIDEYHERRRNNPKSSRDPSYQPKLKNYEEFGLLWHRKRYLTLFFDVRRVHAMGCALVMFAIHIGLLIVAYNAGGRHYETYQAEYTKATSSWKASSGPNSNDCQYYDSSTVPIIVLYGVSPYSAVQQTLFWITTWHIFILGFCLAVFLVALGNDRHWGMHLHWPITLIGPRTSSISMGLTLGFIAWSTLQLGFFADQPEVVRIFVRYSCYNCVASWFFHLFKNEYMKNVVCRRPFFRALTFYSFERMDSDKRFWEYPDYDEP